MGWRSSPWLVGAVVILLHAIGVGWYVRQWKGTVDVLLAVGEERMSHPIYADARTPLGARGYDGQFYYAIAHAPFAKYGHEVDFPAGRQLRLLYPLLGHAASLGHAEWLRYSLPAVNLMMIGLLGVLGAKWAGHHGLSPWYGLPLPFVVNALIPALRNLTDATAMTTAFWLMYAALRDQRPWRVGLAGLAAVFAREQNVAILALVIGHSLWHKRWGAAAACALAAAVWGAWVWRLTEMYGVRPFLPTDGNFTAPFRGWPVAWAAAMKEWNALPDTKYRAFTRGGWLALALAAGVFAVQRRRPGRRGPALVAVMAVYVLALKTSAVPAMLFDFVVIAYHLGLMLAWGVFAVRARSEEMLPLGMATGGLLLHILGGPLIYAEYWAFGRAFFWLPMGLWMLAVQARWEFALRWAALTVYFPLGVALHR